MKDKAFVEVENMLKSYKSLKIEIENMDLIIKELELIGSNDKEVCKLKHKRLIKLATVRKIDNVINENMLDDYEEVIIQERYFNKKSNKDIAYVLNVTPQTASQYKKKLINKLIPLLINISNFR